MSKLILTLILCFLIIFSNAQKSPSWNNKKCAVVLTYDDALHVHLDKAIPALDSLGFKGTFYLSAYFPGSRERIADWRKAAANGHELANHTLYHPCNGNSPGRGWVSAERKMENYSMNRLLEEIRMTNVFLESIDGKKKRTFAYPCGDTSKGDTSYVDHIRNDFVSARGVKSEMHAPGTVDLFLISSYMINNDTAEQMIALVKEAMKTNSLLVFLFHGVGGEHNLNVDLKEHSKLLHFLKDNEKDIWVAPFLEVTEYMKKHHSDKK